MAIGILLAKLFQVYDMSMLIKEKTFENPGWQIMF